MPARSRPLRARRRGRRFTWRRRPWPRLTRDAILFGLGVAGIVHEVALRSPELPERFYILATCLTLCGLPVMLGLDDHRRQPGQDGEGNEDG